jgi:NAD(P)-dependent dehydrogenase (short-subunit alcohol dehydrogenase family)
VALACKSLPHPFHSDVHGYNRFETFVGVPPNEENFKKFLFNVPLGRLTDPVDVANYCLFLASDEAKFITGTCLEVDGGRGI